MAFTAADLTALTDKVVSLPAALGVYETMTAHEPKNAPGHGITWALWVQSINPVPGLSGLSSTAARLEYTIRLYTPMIQEPQDGIDPDIIMAAMSLIGAYSGDLDLGGSVICVDLLGAYGTPLSSKAGYLNQDNKLYRVMDVTLPIVIDAVWTQARGTS